MKKRVLAVMLVLAMLFNSLPLAYAAAGGAADSTNGPLSLTANSRETGLSPSLQEQNDPANQTDRLEPARAPSRASQHPKSARPMCRCTSGRRCPASRPREFSSPSPARRRLPHRSRVLER